MEAQVFWNEPAQFSLKDSLKKFYQYGKGDAQAGLWLHPKKQVAAHNIKISVVFVRYLLGLSLLFLSLIDVGFLVFLSFSFFVYLAWSIFKWRDVVGSCNFRLESKSLASCCPDIIRYSSDGWFYLR